MEKILRFYEYKARDIIRGKTFSTLSQRERQKGNRTQRNFHRVRQELRVQSWDLWHLEMQHCSARKRERKRRRERVWRGSSKSDERLPPASVNIK